jgi:hypothetical protein
MARRQTTWRDLAASIVTTDGALKVPPKAFTAFAGCRVPHRQPSDEEEARKRTPRLLRDDLARAFLFARVRALGVDPMTLREFARNLGPSDFALSPLGVAAILAEAERSAAQASADKT